MGEAQGGRVVTDRRPGRRKVLAVGLVDGDHVGQFQDALLDALQLVAGTGQHQDEEEVDHGGHHGLGLADPHSLHQHHVVSCGLKDHHRLPGGAGNATEGPGAGRGPHEG